MGFNTSEFKNIVADFHTQILQVPIEYVSVKLEQDKWSLKEIIGHLIDSASNNHQRFVRLQEGDLLEFPIYNQESWIRIQKYADYDWKSLVALWELYNDLLLHLIKNLDTNCLSNVWKANDESISLEKLIADYYKHMSWHIDHFTRRLSEIME